jgi:hypothetical protein
VLDALLLLVLLLGPEARPDLLEREGLLLLGSADQVA